jgi:hypothetical protein
MLSLKESKNIPSSSLDDEYNEFVGLLFAGNTAMEKVEYHNALFYIFRMKSLITKILIQHTAGEIVQISS